MPVLTLLIMISRNFRAGRIFYGSKIGQPILAKGKRHLDPFPKTFPPSSNEYFKIYPKKINFLAISQKWQFFSSVVFVVFVAFWGTTMLFFQKYSLLPPKTFGFWVVLRRWGTISDLIGSFPLVHTLYKEESKKATSTVITKNS